MSPESGANDKPRRLLHAPAAEADAEKAGSDFFAASGPAFLAMSGFDAGAFGLLLFLMTVGALPAMTVLGNLILCLTARPSS